MPCCFLFDEADSSAWPLFATADEVRSKFAGDTAITVAIGGWGDTVCFSRAAETDDSRKNFAGNVRAMVDYTGADGMSVRFRSLLKLIL